MMADSSGERLEPHKAKGCGDEQQTHNFHILGEHLTRDCSNKLLEPHKAEGYGLRKRKIREPEKPTHIKAMSGAERSRLYRARRNEDALRHTEYLDAEKQRSKMRRQAMGQMERMRYNEKAKVRNAKSRAKKKQQQQLNQAVQMSTPTRRSVRLDDKEIKAKRETERQRIQKYRDNMTPQKRRRVNEKRMRRYYAKKEEKQKAALSKNVCEPEMSKKSSFKFKINLKKDILSGRKVLSALKLLLKGKGKVKQKLEEFGLFYHEDKNDSLVKAIEKTKKKRDVNTLKMRRFVAKSVKDVKKKYKLGFDNRTIKRSKERSMLYQKQSRFRPVIAEFFENRSVHLPGMKTVSKKSLTQKKILQAPVAELFKEFRNENPDIQVSLKTFFRHRPKHVLSCTKTPLEQCKCEICMNPALKLKTFNRQTGQQLQLNALIDKTLCPNNSKFHKLDCLQRLCNNCGPSILIEELSSYGDIARFVTWEKWDYVSTNGKKHLEKVERQGVLDDLISELTTELKTLPIHIFTHRWQADQYKSIKSLPPKDCAVCTFDFAQNYVCTSQDQPQSSYYGMRQITVHPVVIQRQCPEQCGGIITNNIVFFSDDLKHDAYFVQEVTTSVIHFLRNAVAKIFVFSDGASSQYKAKLPFSLITDIKDIKIERHFFGSRHGKSACDALGGVIKTAARQAVVTRSVSIGSAKELFEFCRDSLSTQAEGCCGSNRSFRLVTGIARPKTDSNTLKTVPGTRKLHAVLPLAPNVIATRNLSCFCEHCIDGDFSACLNADYVSPWDKIKLSSAKQSSLDILEQVSERVAFFYETQKILCSCSSFHDFRLAALRVSELVGKFPLERCPNITVRSLKCHVDKIALGLRPPQVPENSVPLVTVGDGNCMPRSLCLAFSGSDEWHRELRCRIAIELALNEDFYLQEESLSEGDGDLDCSKVLDVIAKLSDSIVADGENGIDVRATFQAEVMTVIQSSTYMGMWQLFAAASVLQCTIVSIYPNQGWSVFQKLHNRIIRPRNGKASDYISIMWSSLRNDMSGKHWVANHIVPLVSMTAPDLVIVEEPKSKDSPTFRNIWDEIENVETMEVSPP